MFLVKLELDIVEFKPITKIAPPPYAPVVLQFSNLFPSMFALFPSTQILPPESLAIENVNSDFEIVASSPWTKIAPPAENSEPLLKAKQ